MNAWFRAAEFLERYAEINDQEEARQHATEKRIAEVVDLLHALPDQEALRAHLNRRDARALRFLARALRSKGEQEEREAITQPEIMRLGKPMSEPDGD